MLDHATSTTAIIPEVVQKALSLRALQTNSRKPSPASQPTPIQIPLWPIEVRGAPNETLRCALFSAQNRKQPRRYLEEEAISIFGGGVITCTGQELRQDDGTVTLQLIHLLPPGSNVIEFSAYSFCKALGWPINGGSYKRLRSHLMRLRTTTLGIYSKRLKEGVTISLLKNFKWKDITTGKTLTHYYIEVDPSLVQLFKDEHYTLIEWEQRQMLPEGLATWLHAFYSSHQIPHALRLNTLKEHAGLTVQQPKHLRQMFKHALEALKRVGFLSFYSIEGDLVRVSRTKRRISHAKPAVN